MAGKYLEVGDRVGGRCLDLLRLYMPIVKLYMALPQTETLYILY